MNVRVLLHVRLLVEALPAVLARVGARVAVDEQMSGQRRRPLEALAALFTLECAFVCVYRPVLRETDSMSECLIAHVTSVRPLPAVRPSHVNLKSVRRREQLLARDALVR